MNSSKKALAWYSGFDSGFIDFEHGIRVGRLLPAQRITQIVKRLLQLRYECEMVCDRWGRGVYWQWICWVPKPNREAKPISSGYNFGSAKFFISLDREQHQFLAGLQLERAPKRAGADDFGVELQKDWDWHILLTALKGEMLPREIRRLLADGFKVRVGAFSAMYEYNRRTWNVEECRRRAARFPAAEWGAFQLFWPMKEKEIRATPGPEVVEAIAGVFDELGPAMNLCMYQPCLKIAGGD